MRQLLGEMQYALSEAMVNTALAIEKETRPDIKKQLEEDYTYFADLQRRVQDAWGDARDVKRGLA